MANKNENNKNEKDRAAKHISKEKLKKYIQKYLNDGYTPSYLKKFLLDQGYDKDLVEKTYSELGLKLEPELQERFREIEKKLIAAGLESYTNYFGKMPKWGHAAIAAVVVLVIVTMLYPADESGNGSQADDLSRTFSVKDCRQDKNCFIAEARKCNGAVYSQDLEGSVIEFSSGEFTAEEAAAAVDNGNCILTKRFKSFSAAEPKEIKDLFEDLEMTCSYRKESFNQSVVNDLVAGIETCDGLLKDAIYELRIAQIELEQSK
ncbi:hypothetical protein HYU06_05010 [Candidatus Woesearchaeota archaeon]|nr:hypothetical protein [Candidatus Woesearchaeota archaeon]